MDLSKIVIPETPLNLDTSVHTFATDGNGHVVKDDAGKPIQIALDKTSGKYFRRIPSVKGSRPVGALSHASSDERFRGLWVPLAQAPAPARWTPPAYPPVTE